MSKKFPDFVPPTQIAYTEDGSTTLHLRKCRLAVERDGRWDEHVFDQSVVTVGAMDDNDLVLPDETVSRYHCRIVQEGNAYVVKDLDSTNGTFVNKVRVREAFLRPGCQLGLGKARLEFQSVDEKVRITPSAEDRFGDIIGANVKMRELFGILEKIAPTDTTIVIEGETGTGKEVVARTIHQRSHRANEPFVVFDCSAVPDNLIESELFGHERGSFTGAVSARPGLFEMADKGTIFLDELGELTPELQPKLLRVLETREVRRVGGNRSVRVDVRVIAATNRRLEEEVRAGRFREDLYYRLSVVRLFLPSLRERTEDIPLLVRHFLKSGRFNRDGAGRLRVTALSREALQAMLGYAWPGNVRELVNVVERACSFAETDTIEMSDLPTHMTGSESSMRAPGLAANAVVRAGSAAPAAVPAGGARGEAAARSLEDAPEDLGTFKDAKEKWVTSFERDYVLRLLERNDFNISHAAREAEIDRKYFRKLMKKYGLDARDLDARDADDAS